MNEDCAVCELKKIVEDFLKKHEEIKDSEILRVVYKDGQKCLEQGREIPLNQIRTPGQEAFDERENAGSKPTKIFEIKGTF